MKLQPHQQRVVDEKTELDEKRDKLSIFFDSDIYNGLDEENKSLLRIQHGVMTQYSDILSKRIGLFK